MKNFIFLTILAMFVVGCGSEGGGSSGNEAPKKERSITEQLEALYDSGVWPRLDRSDSLTGPDENSNGVRDDIEAYIEKTYVVEKERKAVMQIARAFQGSFSADMSKNANVQKEAIRKSKAMDCLFATLKSGKDGKRFEEAWNGIKAMTYNTKPRFEYYVKYSHAFDGAVFPLYSTDTCEKE
jgi:hypothetical protein